MAESDINYFIYLYFVFLGSLPADSGIWRAALPADVLTLIFSDRDDSFNDADLN